MRLGVLDVGSNTIHLQVMDAHPGARPTPTTNYKVDLRLTEYLDISGAISAGGIKLLNDAIEEAIAHARVNETDEILAFATSAVRDASNGAQIIADINKQYEIDLQVLSGEDEASMTFLAVRRWLGWSAGNLLVLDIGGGSLEIAIDAIQSANSPHHLLSVNKDGGISHFTSLGNDTAHIILRGGKDGPNFSEEHVEKTCDALSKKSLVSKVMVDFSHANSEKQYKNQLKVGANIASQIENGSNSIFGVMIESHLNEGNQKVGPLSSLKYGVSITDSCIGWTDTEMLLRDLAKSVKVRNN